MPVCYTAYINPQVGYSSMEIRVLKYFLAVVRGENILRASEVLHITQPSLSRQLAQLENALGVQLLFRRCR